MTRKVSLLSVLLTFLSAACGINGLSFRQDNRLVITSPGDRALVEAPVIVEWTVRDFDVTGKDGSRRIDAGYFGVFVDRAPIPPEETLAWLARDDAQCRLIPGCPNDDYFRQINVFSTTETEITIERFPELSTDEDRRDFHEVVIVLLNGRGERIGESAFAVEFEVKRRN